MTMGQVLKSARELRGLSLRRLEKLTGISNAYLSQLENDYVKEPSPHILHKLARVYEVPYRELLLLAGYLRHDGDSDFAHSATHFLFHAIKPEEFTPGERSALIEFAKFLRSKRESTTDAK